ncbi:MAG TPA: V-type ATP synthase subunit I [Firmicutes bacterium]|nr:V-type ATP synthase subunit I [Bacillota bacterium]
MPIVDMKKIFLFSHQQEKDTVINILRDIGVVELVDIKESNEWEEMKSLLVPEWSADAVSFYESLLGEVRYCLDFLQRHFPLQKNFVQQFAGAKINLTPAQYEDYISRKEEIKAVYQSCRKMDEKLTNLRNEETRCHNLLQSLAPWAGFSLPLEKVENTLRIQMQLFTVATDELPSLQKSLTEISPDHYLEVVSSDKELTYFLLISLSEEAGVVREALKESGATEISFPGIAGTAAQAISMLKEKLENIQHERAELLKKVEDLINYRPHLMAYYDFLEDERDKKEAINKLAGTKTSFMLEGWIPLPLLSSLEKVLSEKTETAFLLSRDPKAEEKAPVLLQNGGAADAFEVVTKLYSTPSRREIDPTPLMAPFFFVFFGLCLTDAGYGILLSLLAIIIFRKIKLAGMGKQLIKLLFLGGISSFIMGVLMGGWFGDLVKLKPLWFNPLDDPMRMLIVCFVLGFIQIFFGMGVRAYQDIKAGRILDAVFDQGLWFILLIGLISLAFPQFSAAGKWLAICGAIGLILTQGRSQKNIFRKFFSGLVSLYNITGYLSDVLSYSRLLALGLATGVIASAINTMGGLLAGSIVGVIIMIILLIGGHFFNLIIGTLGAYVHTSRLQYIEFFGKFFEGGGKAFQPFCKTTKYVDIEEREA